MPSPLLAFFEHRCYRHIHHILTFHTSGDTWSVAFYLGLSRARAFIACRGCRRGLFGHFFSRLSFLFSFSLSLGDGPI